MHILLDECLPRRLKRDLIGHEAHTVPEMGWAGKQNGDLLPENAVPDARIAALCLRHGVKKLLSADRDFSRFPALVTENPLHGTYVPPAPNRPLT